MTLILVLAALAAAGFFGGRWLRRQPAATRRRAAWAMASLPLAAFGLIPLGGLLGSNTLGWLGGLSLMFLIPLALPLLLGGALGWFSARAAHAAEAPAPSLAATTAAITTAAAATAAGSAPHATPAAAAGSRKALLGVMLGIGCGFWVLIGLGFRWNGQTAPPVVAAGLWPALGVLLVLLGLGLRAAVLQRRRTARWAQRVAADHPPPLSPDARRRWLAEMAADPRRRIYAERIAAGDLFWTPERVAYDLDPQATACCPHLAPLERALRATGLPLKRVGAGQASAPVHTHEAATRRRCPLPDFVRYEEFVVADRSMDSQPVARWRCTRCESVLTVCAAQEAGSGGPGFPGDGVRG